MVMENGKILQFGRFWFPQQVYAVPYNAIWSGLYTGWVLVFVLQILTMTYLAVYVLNLRVSQRLREHHSVWFVVLPLLTIAFAVYQLFVQHEMMYHNYSLNPIRPNVGFWTALLSFTILLVAVLGAPEQSHLKAVPKSFKRTLKRRWPVLVLLFTVALPVVAELEVQTNVSKGMLVENRKDFQAIHENPALWEPNYNKISLLASLFRARITDNHPDYAYCRLDVPVVSYGILIAILNASGYWAGEPTFFHLYASG